MINKVAVVVLVHLAVVFFACSEGRDKVEHPQRLHFLKINDTQNAKSCSYTITIKTSCSSPTYTRDQISISFGDALGNQVYLPRIDDPSLRTFERCSTDTFDINGPCTYDICYLYLYRSGRDGWKPERVTVYGYYTKSVSFYYDVLIPQGVWYGFNLCNSASSSTYAE